MRCKGRLLDPWRRPLSEDSQCRRPAQAGGEFCFFHNPANKDRLAAIVRRAHQCRDPRIVAAKDGQERLERQAFLDGMRFGL